MSDLDLVKEGREVAEGKLPADPLGLYRRLADALARTMLAFEGKHFELLRAREEISQQRARAEAAEGKLKASGQHCATCVCGRRAPVQGEGNLGTHRAGTLTMGTKGYGPGTVSWEEHLLAWSTYARRYGEGQTAERMAQRGGFGYSEMSELLGHPPETWLPR